MWRSAGLSPAPRAMVPAERESIKTRKVSGRSKFAMGRCQTPDESVRMESCVVAETILAPAIGSPRSSRILPPDGTVELERTFGAWQASSPNMAKIAKARAPFDGECIMDGKITFGPGGIEARRLLRNTRGTSDYPRSGIDCGVRGWLSQGRFTNRPQGVQRGRSRSEGDRTAFTKLGGAPGWVPGLPLQKRPIADDCLHYILLKHILFICAQ